MKPSRGARVSTKPRNTSSRRPNTAQNNAASGDEKEASAATSNKASTTSSRAQRGSSRAMTNNRAGSRTAAAANRADKNEPPQGPQQVPKSNDGGISDLKQVATTRYKKLKSEQEKERADAIRNGRMHDPNKPRTLAEAITPVGTCPDMCPEFERVERIVQNDVWGPEGDRNAKPDPRQTWKVTPDEARMVKKFRRAAAGIDEQLPSELRPPAVLQKTTDFLFNEVIGQAEHLSQVHHFVWDRTRAIRNDFSIQQLTKRADVTIAMDCYERIARFHILSLHQFALAEKPYEQYDDKQEREQLDKTLLSLIQYYDDNRNRCQSPNEEEFRAYYIIFQISGHAPDMENRVQHWPRKMLQSRHVSLALALYTAAANPFDDQGPLRPFDTPKIASANWARWWEMLENVEVPYLLACVAEIQFSIVRRNALWTIWQAYKPLARTKIEDWTLKEMQDPLRYEDEAEVETFVNKFGIGVEERGDGQQYVDLASRQDKELPPLSVTLRKQQKSTLVEDKRQGRSFPAVIDGMSVEQARAAGLIDPKYVSPHTKPPPEVEMADDDDYLFLRPDPPEPTPKPSKLKFTMAQTLNPSAPKWDPSSSTLFNTAKQNEPITAAQETAQVSQSPAFPSSTLSAAPSAGTGAQPSLFTPNATTGSQLFASTTSSTSTNDSEQSSIFKRPFQSTNFPTPPPNAENVQPATASIGTGNVGSFLFAPKQQPQAASPAPVTYPTLPSFDGTFSSMPASQPPVQQSSQAAASPGFNFNSKPSPSSINTQQQQQQTPNASPASLNKAHKPQSSSPLSRPPLNQEDNETQSAQQPANQSPSLFQSFDKSSTAYSSHPLALTSFSPWLFPRNEQTQSQPQSQPQTQPQMHLQQQAQQSQVQQKPIKTSPAPITDSPQQSQPKSIQQPKIDAKAKKSALNQVEIEERRTRTMDRVALAALLEPGGLLEQYMEYHVQNRIYGAQRRMFFAKINKEADDHRLKFLETKYYRKWKTWWWERKVKREGTARRQRLKAAKEARIAEDFRRSQREQEEAQWENFKQSQIARRQQRLAQASTTEAQNPAAMTKPDLQFEPQLSQQSQKDEFDGKAPAEHSSAMPPPPRPESSPDRPRVYNALGLANPMNPPAHRRSQSAWTHQYIAERPDAARPMRSSSLKNPFSPFTSMTNEKPLDSRIDKTQSVYFKLKARGIDQIDRHVKESAAAAAQRKRPRTSDSSEAPDAPPRKLNNTDISNSQIDGEIPAVSPPDPLKTGLSPSQLKDEELFAAARKIREEMRESQSFFRKEAERDGLARSQSSHAGSPPDNASVASAASKYRAKVDSIMREKPSADSRPSSRQSNASQRSFSSINAPPAYRNRVSKFVPREMYAHVRSQQSSVSGASPRRLSSGSAQYRSDSVTGSNARIAERAERYLAEEKDRIMRRSTNSEGDANGAWLSPALDPMRASATPNPANIPALDAPSTKTHTTGFDASQLGSSTGSEEQKFASLKQSPTIPKAAATVAATDGSKPVQKPAARPNQSSLRSNPFAALEMDENEDESEAGSSVQNGYGHSNRDLESEVSDDDNEGFEDEDEDEEEISEEEDESNGPKSGLSTTQARDKFGGKAGTSVEDAIEL